MDKEPFDFRGAFFVTEKEAVSCFYRLAQFIDVFSSSVSGTA